ncbi:MAG: winged helix-turn-helix transcriptional regulator [Methanobacterium sp.]|nr:winged helix-turn-helix transcriptional regulator [Methanobacterium sp.]
MKVFKKKGELTHFQILAEIAKQEPHLRQKDIAKKLGITVQAVSENIKSLADEGLVETGKGRSNYKITKKGIESVKTDAVNLRKYADQVLDTMNAYKSIWPAIAREDYSAGDGVWLEMDDGTLYATSHETSAHAEVLNDVKKCEDVALIKLSGTIELQSGNVVIIKLPTINQGGSRSSDLEKIKGILQDPMRKFDRIGIMGTVSRAVTQKLNIKADFEFATPEATVAAAKRGLNVLVFAVGKMTGSITQKLDNEIINYVIEDVRK